MKKLLLTALVSLSLLTQSQSVVLTQSFNEPVVGDTSRSYFLDTTAFSSGLMVNSTGADHLWNYQALVVTNTILSSSYVSTTAVSASTNYPGSTMVQKQGGLNSFLKSTTTPSVQTELRGIEFPGVSINFTNTAVMIRYPFTFGNSVTDAFSGTFTYSTTSGNAAGNTTTTADGTGTLVLPNGISLTNVLRVKSTQTINLTSGFFPVATIKQTQYNFYDGSMKYPVLSLGYTSMQTFGSSSPTVTPSYSIHRDYLAVGLSENLSFSSDIKIYPNPANDVVNISITNNLITPKEIIIYSQLGSVVLRTNYTQQLDIAALTKGIYLIEIKSEESVLRKKLIRN